MPGVRGLVLVMVIRAPRARAQRVGVVVVVVRGVARARERGVAARARGVAVIELFLGLVNGGERPLDGNASIVHIRVLTRVTRRRAGAQGSLGLSCNP